MHLNKLVCWLGGYREKEGDGERKGRGRGMDGKGMAEVCCKTDLGLNALTKTYELLSCKCILYCTICCTGVQFIVNSVYSLLFRWTVSSLLYHCTVDSLFLIHAAQFTVSFTGVQCTVFCTSVQFTVTSCLTGYGFLCTAETVYWVLFILE